MPASERCRSSAHKEGEEKLFMRRGRCVRRGQEAAYHCMSRTVGGEHLFGDREREVFRNRLFRLAAFCQVKVLTYACLSNHFHIVLKVLKVVLSDLQLFRCLKRYYGRKHPRTLEWKRVMGRPESPLYQKLRGQYLGRMGELSVFMKELKEGFSKWFNAIHERFGTLWAERFKSVIVEVGLEPLRAVCAYVDLNGVRAGLARDPQHYRFCGYAEALARAGPARDGLASILPGQSWEEQIAGYRLFLVGKGAVAKNAEQAVLDPQKVLEVYQAGGRLSPAEVLLLKVRYFSEGIALGSGAFVEDIFKECWQRHCKVRQQGGWSMQGADWGGLMSLKRIKKPIEAPAQSKA